MLIADSQVHIWSANTPERPWRAGAKPHRELLLDKKQLLKEMDEAGVHRAVLVPPAIDCNRNDLSLQASRQNPDHFVTMGCMDVEAPDARSRIATWCEQPGMAGMRCSFSDAHWTPVLNEGRLDWLWAGAEKAGMPMMINIHGKIPQIVRVAQRYPSLKIALDHLTLSSKKKGEEAFRDIDEIAKLANYPNIMVKISALPTYATDTYPFRQLHPYIRKVYDAFGPKRLFWGSDLSRLKCSYRQAITMYTEEIPWLTAEDKEWIMGRSLCEWLGWKMPGA